MAQALVLDAQGKKLAPTDEAKARRLVETGRAVVVQENPLTVRLNYPVDLPERSQPETNPHPSAGKQVLLHICCAPCATYSAGRLRELGFGVTGFWYNPNIHPFSEHERRRKTLVQYAAQVGLPVIWEPGYEVVAFMRTIQGQETFRTRCRLCYQARLERTAQVAAREKFDAFSTTLLISPYQDQAMIRTLGDQAGERWGVPFYFENLRRGWAAHFDTVRELELYSQSYCGCLYSEWEALDRDAATYPRTPEQK